MRVFALFLLTSILLFSCQKEPDVDLEPNPPAVDSLTITYFSPDSVMVGLNIKIGGTGFGSIVNNTTVLLNGVPIIVVSVNDSVIIATAPLTATTGKITIKVNGKTATSATNIIVYDQPPVTPEGNVWVRRADFKGPVPSDMGPEYYHSFSLNGKGYYLGRNELWEYSPDTDSWSQKASAPSQKVNSYGFCFTIQDKAYIGLGAPEPGNTEISEYKQVWEYNATTDSWARKKDFPGSPRVVPFSFSTGTTGYIGGGDTLNAGISDDYVFDFWKYESATDSWSRLNNFPGLRSLGLSGVGIGNDGYVVELGANNPTAPLSDHKNIYIWKYNSGDDSWQKKAMVPVGDLRYAGGGTSFVIDSKIYLGAGAHDSTEVNGQIVRNNFWMYDPVDDTWTKKEDIGGGLRLFGSGFAINGKGYIGLGTGGTADEIKIDFWEYNP